MGKKSLHEEQSFPNSLIAFHTAGLTLQEMASNNSNGTNSSGLTAVYSGSPPPFIELQYLVLWCVVYLILATFAICGNVLIILVFSKKRNLRTRTNYFVIGLALGDILVGTATIPLYVTLLILLFNQNFKAATFVRKVFSPMDILSGMLSILQLMTISVERVYAIAFPLRHRTTSARINFIILATVWLIAAGIASLNFFIPKGPEWKGTFLIYSTLGFFIPFSVIFFAYTSIWIIIKNKTKIPRNRARVVKKESRTALTVFALILLFLVTWLPFFSLNLVLFSCASCAAAVPLQVVLFFKALHYSGSALNPVVYSARMPEFRRPISILLKERRFTTSFYRRSIERQTFRRTSSRRRDVELSDLNDQQTSSYSGNEPHAITTNGNDSEKTAIAGGI